MVCDWYNDHKTKQLMHGREVGRVMDGDGGNKTGEDST